MGLGLIVGGIVIEKGDAGLRNKAGSNQDVSFGKGA